MSSARKMEIKEDYFIYAISIFEFLFCSSPMIDTEDVMVNKIRYDPCLQ